MRVIGYVFLEKAEDQTEEIRRQEKALQEYASTLGARLERCVVEKGNSVKRPFRKRTKGKKILADVEAEDILLVEKAEWVLSSAREGLRLVSLLQEKKVGLHCLDLEENISIPAERKLMVYEGGAKLAKGLLQALAVCESSRHGESIKAAKRQMRQDGKYIGGPVPFGWYVKDGILCRDREQQKIIRHIKKWRDDRWSYRDIASKLLENFDVSLSHEGIRRILLNEEKN